MPRPYWSGQIQISLVSFGVKLFVATEAASDVRFHQIDRRTGERVRHQKVLASAIDRSPEEAADPVEAGQIVKGYEYSKGQYITLEPAELDHLRVPSKHTMEVTQFVDLADLPPQFFEKPYFVVPENAAQTEAFLTVRQALADTGKVALSKIAFAGREHVVAIAPAPPNGLMAYTLRYAAELRDPADYFRDIKTADIQPDSLALAKELIQRKASAFKPGAFVDGYEAALHELVEAKLKHAPVPRDETPASSKSKVVSLMEALRKSVSADNGAAHPDSLAKKSRSAAGRPAKGPVLVRSTRKAPARATPKASHSGPRRRSA